MDVRERQPLLVDHAGGDLVLRHRPDGHDRHVLPRLVARGADPPDEILGEAPVELAGVIDERDPEVRVRMLGQVVAADAPCALAGGPVAERQERRQVERELPLGGHQRSAGHSFA